LQSPGVGNFLAVWSEVGIVAELAGGLASATARGDGAGRTELVGEPVEDGPRAVARSDAAASEEDVFVIGGICEVTGAVGFGEGVASDGAPVEFCVIAGGASGIGIGFFGDPQAVAVIVV
jgi:hypothetical protein